MKKKNIATVMATTMAVASVMPVFAAQENATIVPVDVRTANGEILSVKSNTVDGETVYSVEKEKLNDKAVVSAAKKTMDETIAKLEGMSKETIKVMEDGNVVVKNKYDIKIDDAASIFRYSVNQENGKLTDNKIVVVVKNNETKEVTKYEFNGVNKYDLDNSFGQGDVKFETIAIDLAYKAEYTKMAVLQYQLENAADKIVVNQEKFRPEGEADYTKYNLRLTVTLKDGTKLGNIELMNVQAFDKDSYVSLPSNGDILGHWAEENILEAMANKWVDTSASFRPEDSITRAEFVKIVNRAFNVPVNNKQPRGILFKDLEANMWYNKEIAAAVEAGYITGYEDGTFRPNQPISRQEAAKIIAKLHNKNVDVEIEGQDTKTNFKDDADIAIWADESVDALTKAGVITGYEDNTFKPAGNIKRAEAVVMMSRAAN